MEKLKYEARANIVKALAHPTRLFIVDQLTEGEKCVCELTEMVGVDISTISKHLLLMKNAGLIKSRKEGTTVFYTLKCPCLNNFFSCIEGVIESNIKEQNCCL